MSMRLYTETQNLLSLFFLFKKLFRINAQVPVLGFGAVEQFCQIYHALLLIDMQP